MSRSPRRALAAAVTVVVGAVLVAGCTTSTWDTSGVDHPTTTAQKLYPTTAAGLTDSITDHLSSVGPDLNEWAPSRADARCAATRIVAKLGLNRLLDLGFLPQKGDLALPYSDQERTALTGILVGCIDFQAGLLSLFSSYGKLDVTPSSCLSDGIARQGLTQYFAEAYLDGDQPDPMAHDSRLGIGMSALMAQCFTPASDLLPGTPVQRFPSELDSTTTTRRPAGATTTTAVPATTGSGG